VTYGSFLRRNSDKVYHAVQLYYSAVFVPMKEQIQFRLRKLLVPSKELVPFQERCM
jgi:hypothetical protein